MKTEAWTHACNNGNGLYYWEALDKHMLSYLRHEKWPATSDKWSTAYNWHKVWNIFPKLLSYLLITLIADKGVWHARITLSETVYKQWINDIHNFLTRIMNKSRVLFFCFVFLFFFIFLCCKVKDFVFLLAKISKNIKIKWIFILYKESVWEMT